MARSTVPKRQVDSRLSNVLEQGRKGREARSGQFIPVDVAERRPSTTVIETVKPKPKGK